MVIPQLRVTAPEVILFCRQSACRWLSHKPSSRLPLLSARLTVTFLATKHYHPLASTKLYCLVTVNCVWTTCSDLLHENLMVGSRNHPFDCKSNGVTIIPTCHRHHAYSTCSPLFLSHVSAVQWGEWLAHLTWPPILVPHHVQPATITTKLNWVLKSTLISIITT